MLRIWWPEAESNCRHEDFQSSALPTELSGQDFRNWCGWGDSNSHGCPLEPKSSASTNFATSAWGDRWDLNPRQPESQSGTLPTELRPPLNYGTPGRIRTCYPRLRRPMLYPDELRAHKLCFNIVWSEQRDSNPRPSGPKPDALPSCAMLRSWWPEAESNCRHEDFQSSALPTELSGRVYY